MIREAYQIFQNDAPVMTYTGRVKVRPSEPAHTINNVDATYRKIAE